MTNTLFPGRPDYTGPTEGIFGLLHHDTLMETSHDVTERVAYVKKHKPPHEIAVRLHNMIYLGDCDAAAQRKPLDDAYWAQRKPLDDAYWAQCKALDDAYRAQRKALDDAYRAQRKPLYDAYKAQCKPLYDAIVAYIRGHIPDCAWNGTELEFPNV